MTDPTEITTTAELRSALRSAAYIRGELLFTIFMDGLLLLGAYAVAAGLGWVAHLINPESNHWSLWILRTLLDVGLVGTVTVVTIFDLAKRIRNAYRSLTAS